jgi:hypothetical protein
MTKEIKAKKTDNKVCQNWDNRMNWDIKKPSKNEELIKWRNQHLEEKQMQNFEVKHP